MVCAGTASAAEHRCATLADAVARLACYDRIFPPLIEAERASAAGKSTEELKAEFGLSVREVEERKPDAERAQRIDRIEAKVSSVRNIQGGQRVVSLDNGQVWQLTEGGSKGPLSAGDDITIRRALMGSFILVTQGGVGLRARRVR